MPFIKRHEGSQRQIQGDTHWGILLTQERKEQPVHTLDSDNFPGGCHCEH